MKAHTPLTIFAAVGALSACTSAPLAPTGDMVRAAAITSGQTKSQVEASMARPGRTVSFPLKPEETVQIWRIEDHFLSRCLFVTYDTQLRVKDVAIIERERDERGRSGALLAGSC